MLKKLLLGLLIIFFLISCSNTQKEQNALESMSTKQYAQKGIELLKLGHYSSARRYFTRALKNDPKDCHFHFLNALTYQLEGKSNNYRLLDLAEAGYQTAIKFCPHNSWAYYYLGVINYQKKNFSIAEINFSQALKFGNGKAKVPFLNAFIQSAKKTNDYQSIDALRNQLKKLDPNSPMLKELNLISKRIPREKYPEKANRPNKNSMGSIHYNPRSKQIFVDAVIILSREIDEKTRGVNLLNGLQLQYGLASTTTRFGTSNWKNYADALNNNPVLGGTGGNPPLNYSSLITHALSIPAINYNLDIFNDFSESDQVLSRPTLLARDGQTSTYFSGTELLLGVSGLNTGTVQIIPVGLTMKVTPTFLKDGSINLEVDLGRQFLTEGAKSSVGTFSDSARTIKENTHTSVNIHFGETVILSALSEDIHSSTGDKVPGIGDIPLLRLGFNKKVGLRQNTSLLILLTPQKNMSAEGMPSLRPGNMMQVANYLKKYVDPTSNLSVVIKHMSKLDIYKRNKVFNKDFYNTTYRDWALKTNYLHIDAF